MFTWTHNSVTIIFSENRGAELSSILSSLNYARKDGEPYKYVTVNQSSSYRPSGATNSLSATKIEAKGVSSYIIGNRVDFSVGENIAMSLLQNLHSFGNVGSVVIKGLEFKLPFSAKGGNIVDATGVSIGFDSGGDSIPDTTIHALINRLQTDNSRILAPLIQRYVNTLHQAGRNKHLISGYAHLPTYLAQLREPSLTLSTNTSTEKADFSMSFAQRGSNALIVDGIGSRGPMSTLSFSGDLVANQGSSIDPYILLTTAPFKLMNQKFPSFITKLRHGVVYATPILFNSRQTLSELRGGVNLLK